MIDFKFSHNNNEVISYYFYTELAQHRRDDAGNTDTTYYQTNMQPANWYKWFTKSASSSQKPEPESQNPQNPEPSTPENESNKPESSGGSASDSATTDSSDDEGWTEVGQKYSLKYSSITMHVHVHMLHTKLMT